MEKGSVIKVFPARIVWSILCKRTSVQTGSVRCFRLTFSEHAWKEDISGTRFCEMHAACVFEAFLRGGHLR